MDWSELSTAPLDAALHYASLGYGVFPCLPGRKTPATAHGWKDSSTDPERIRQLWARDPARNVGISCAGLLVVDLDSDDHPWIKAPWEEEPVPPPTARTPRGGWHFYFRRPEGKNWTISSERLAEAVDIRTDGGYTVEFPSIVNEGDVIDGRYIWEVPLCSIAELPLPPDWLIAALDLSHNPPAETPETQEERIPTHEDDPGTDFNIRGTWDETGLFDAGWKWAKQTAADTGHLTRPGKADGTSATVGICSSKENGWPLFYSFSGNCDPLPANRPLNRHAVFTYLNHGGNFKAAAIDLAARGYGFPRVFNRMLPSSNGNGKHANADRPKVEPPKFEFVPDGEFAVGDYRPTWLVRGMFVKGEPGVIAGPVKTLKTSIAADLGVSVAAGVPFLGAFDVPRALNVAIVSGESGQSTLQSAAKRIVAAKGIDRGDIAERLHWCFTLPVLSDFRSMTAFVGELVDREVGLAILDPLYLMLGSVDAKNMFETGAVLRNISTMLLAEGITPILLHHANRQLPVGEVMELHHLAYSGCDQFMRQFILLNRREKYAQDGKHALWMRAGGSAGHGGLYGIDVDEGMLDEDFGGRCWRVDIHGASEIGQEKKDAKAEARAQEKRLKDDAKLMEAIDAEIERGEPGATKTRIKRFTNWNPDKVEEVIARVVGEGVLEEYSWEKISGKGQIAEVKGFRRREEIAQSVA